MVEIADGISDFVLVRVSVILEGRCEEADHVGKPEPFACAVKGIGLHACEARRVGRRQHAAKKAEGDEDADVGFWGELEKRCPGGAAVLGVAGLDACERLWVVEDDGFSKRVGRISKEAFVFFAL